MNIPEKVKVGGMNYTVTQSDKIIDIKRCRGLINHEMHTIDIDNAVQDKQGCEQTFLHELVHAITRERSIKFDCGDNESITDEIAKGLHQVIIDNPDIFK
jgi:hypothetical protein